uniref:C-C motif chemokine 3-like n=1 Tax=Cyanistes caeruleus TaxID=156563 RepID=A0A8C0VRT5_CYACU
PPSIMRVLAVLLLVSLCHSVGSHWAHLSAPTESIPISCCLAYISRPIPPWIIRSAYRTSSSCVTQAVVLVTKNGREVCVDPTARWVQKYLKHLELLEH